MKPVGNAYRALRFELTDFVRETSNFPTISQIVAYLSTVNRAAISQLSLPKAVKLVETDDAEP